MMDISIKSLTTNEEFFEVIKLQKIIWRLHNNDDCLPNHLFKAVSEIGGLVLGAFNKTRLAGFLMVMVGFDGIKGVYHHSHILGVHPDLAFQNIGFRLKKAHYDSAKPEGIKLVTWTYDPLLGPNANLNIAKLGGIVRGYKINYYGEVMGESDLVSGIPSDRFWLEWYLQTKFVNNRLAGSAKPGVPLAEYNKVNQVAADNSGFLRMLGFTKPAAKKIMIEIPYDFQSIFDLNKDLALDWRLKTRDLFMACFEQGFTVTNFLHITKEKEKGNYYLLERDFEIS